MRRTDGEARSTNVDCERRSFFLGLWGKTFFDSILQFHCTDLPIDDLL